MLCSRGLSLPLMLDLCLGQSWPHHDKTEMGLVWGRVEGA